MKGRVGAYLSAISLFVLGFLGQPSWALTARVVDDSQRPVVGAQILIGSAVGAPFANNSLVTDAQGQFEIPAEWTTPLPVQISAPGHVAVTYFSAQPSQVSYRLSGADGTDEIELQGTLDSYGTIRSDGKIDFAAVIPALKRSQLLQFDVGAMVSPQSDVIRVLGREVALPSNLVLPRQTESYIFPITLDKPNFRMYVRKPGAYRFVAAHGQFPLKRVVDDVRAGKSIWDVVNYFSLLQSGVEDFDLKSNLSNRTIPVNRLPFNQTVAVTAPTLAADDIMLTVMLNEMDGYLLPSDVKRFKSGESHQLRMPTLASKPMAVSLMVKEQTDVVRIQRQPLAPGDVLNAPFDLLFDVVKTQGTDVVKANFNQISLAVHSDFSQTPKFLALIDAPTVVPGRLTVVPPAPVTGVAPLGMYVVYSQVQMVGSGQMQTEQRTRLWEAWLPDWMSSVELPAQPRLKGQAAVKYRWEVFFLGQELPGGQSEFLGDKVTHVSRNAITL